jgi:DNA repair exonuclease SbcCD ATPase subunit
MRLTRVRLHGFGQFHRGLEVNFAPDRLNVVVGRNEAGKSTLLNAIGGVLFGFRDLNMIRKYEPWEEHDRYAGEVSFVLEDGRAFRVERDFRSGEARLVACEPEGERTLYAGSADPRGAKPEDALYFEQLGELLGFQDETVFRNTAFVGQTGLKAEVSEQIRRLLSGDGDADYKGALHELHSRRAELTADNPWRTKAPARKKALETARESAAEAEAALRAASESLRRAAAAEDELAALESRRRSGEEDLAAKQETLAALVAAAELAARRDAAAERLAETTKQTDQARRLKDKVEECGERVRREYAGHRRAGDDLPAKLTELQAANEELARERAAAEDAARRLAELRPEPNTSLGAGLGGGLLASAAVAGVLTPVGAAAGAVAGAVLGVFGWTIGRRLGTGYSARRRALDEDARAAARSAEERARRVADLEADCGGLLVGRSPADVLAEHRAYRAVMEEGRRAAAALKAVGDLAEWEARRAEAAREDAAIAAAFAEVRSRRAWIDAAATPAALRLEAERARRALEEATTRVTTERTRVEELRIELARASAAPEGDFARLAEESRRGRERERDLELEKDALKEAVDLLDACVKEFRENDVYRLSEDMSRYFARLTGGKYVRVSLGPSLEPAAATPDRSGISPEDLSQGAHDQLYFAMRLAVVGHLARREPPPIFLDDPFVNFDAERLGAARGILAAMEGRQCVMVTCDRQYERWTDAVIDLDKARAAM